MLWNVEFVDLSFKSRLSSVNCTAQIGRGIPNELGLWLMRNGLNVGFAFNEDIDVELHSRRTHPGARSS